MPPTPWESLTSSSNKHNFQLATPDSCSTQARGSSASDLESLPKGVISPLFCPLGQDLTGVGPGALPCPDAFLVSWSVSPLSPVRVRSPGSQECRSRRRTRNTIGWHNASFGSRLPGSRAALPLFWWLKGPEQLKSRWGLQKFTAAAQQLCTAVYQPWRQPCGCSVPAPAALWLQWISSFTRRETK